MYQDHSIVRQVVAKMVSFGFPNVPENAVCTHYANLTESVSVYKILALTPAPVFALVVRKGHRPIDALHVVDFRVGGNIYQQEGV